jgi:hypothetical protein
LAQLQRVVRILFNMKYGIARAQIVGLARLDNKPLRADDVGNALDRALLLRRTGTAAVNERDRHVPASDVEVIVRYSWHLRAVWR